MQDEGILSLSVLAFASVSSLLSLVTGQFEVHLHPHICCTLPSFDRMQMEIEEK